MLKDSLAAGEHNYMVMNETNDNAVDQLPHAIVPQEVGSIEPSPTACASGTGQPMQIQLNIPLKFPIQVLHDIVTHNVTPVEIQQTMVEHKQFEEEDDDESTA